MFDLSVYYMYLRYFDIVGWVFWPVKTVSNITYTVFGGDIKHCSIQSNPSLSHSRGFVMIVVTDSELNRPKKIIVSAKVWVNVRNVLFVSVPTCVQNASNELANT